MKNMLKKRFRGKIYHISKDNFYDVSTFYYSANRKLDKKEPKTKKKVWSLVFFLVNIFVITMVLAIQLHSEEGISSIRSVFNSDIKFEFKFSDYLTMRYII